jgi:hypothetical protein
MISQITTITVVFTALISAISAPVFAVMWWREKRRRLTTAEELSVTREAGERVVEISKKLLVEKNGLASRVAQMEERFRPVLDLDAECAMLKDKIALWTTEIALLRASYQEKKGVHDRLLKEVAVFDDKLAFAEMGVYEPHFDFTDSEEYKAKIVSTREAQKVMVSAKTAVICTTNWTVDGSAAKGETMTGRSIRLTLRAFNSECDAAIANARWNNVNAMEKRILNAHTQIDKHNASNSIFITKKYLNLKLQELYLTHEYREKVKAERDERTEAARMQREEQKLVRDMERAEEEEGRYQRLLDKAKAEAQSVAGPKLDAFQAQIEMLEKDLAEAHAKFERAQAMAERTRSGYVYIISNVGSFGDDVVKIGLTRRLDPTDRVRELGDASVPFLFDTHAIIYSDDAPTLERALHAEFEPLRINAQNYRKEFFRAKLEDVEDAVKRLAPDAAFFKDVEAQEYRETLAKRNAAVLALDAHMAIALPVGI